jgi:GDP-6-deoxy-D-talose 4-dehydrogenase
MNGKTILVTGASGFTGKYVMAAARGEGYRCVALCHQINDSAPGADDVVWASLLDPVGLKRAVAFAKPDYLIHLAAVSFVAHENIGEIYNTNLSGTLNLLQAVTEAAPGLERIILASSAHVYGNAADLPITEMTVPSPVNHYGVSKRAMEMVARLYTELPITVVRPFNYTGIGQNGHFLIPKIVNAFRTKSAAIDLGNTEVARDFCDVRDVAAAYLMLLRAEKAGSVYNICAGRPSALKEIVGTLNRLAGYEIQVRSNPIFFRADEITTLYGTPVKLEAVIGNFRQFSLRDTLNWMLTDNEAT